MSLTTDGPFLRERHKSISPLPPQAYEVLNDAWLLVVRLLNQNELSCTPLAGRESVSSATAGITANAYSVMAESADLAAPINFTVLPLPCKTILSESDFGREYTWGERISSIRYHNPPGSGRSKGLAYGELQPGRAPNGGQRDSLRIPAGWLPAGDGRFERGERQASFDASADGVVDHAPRPGIENGPIRADLLDAFDEPRFLDWRASRFVGVGGSREAHQPASLGDRETTGLQ